MWSRDQVSLTLHVPWTQGEWKHSSMSPQLKSVYPGGQVHTKELSVLLSHVPPWRQGSERQLLRSISQLSPCSMCPVSVFLSTTWEKIDYLIFFQTSAAVASRYFGAVSILTRIRQAFIHFNVTVNTIKARRTFTHISIKFILKVISIQPSYKHYIATVFLHKQQYGAWNFNGGGDLPDNFNLVRNIFCQCFNRQDTLLLLRAMKLRRCDPPANEQHQTASIF